MSDLHTDLPDPNTVTRQSGAMGRVATDGEAPTPEQAVAEAIAARDVAEQASARDRLAAESAARERDEARANARDANAGALTAREQAIETAISSNTSAVEQAKAAIASAQAAGDNIAVADAIDRLTDARAALRDLGNQKAYYADQKTRQPAVDRQQQPQGVRVRTPSGEMDVTSQAKQWMDGHARFYSDSAYYNHAVGAHSTIVADGISEGSPAYFRELDKRMEDFERFEAFQRGEHNVNQRTEQPAVNTPRSQPRASSMGAPVSRATQPSTNSNGIPDPLAIARRLGPGLTVDDLREGARIAGYTRQRGFESDQAGFERYLKDQEEIHQLERNGQPTGLVTDTVYR